MAAQWISNLVSKAASLPTQLGHNLFFSDLARRREGRALWLRDARMLPGRVNSWGSTAAVCTSPLLFIILMLLRFPSLN